jgi:hypothetical protein
LATNIKDIANDIYEHMKGAKKESEAATNDIESIAEQIYRDMHPAVEEPEFGPQPMPDMADKLSSGAGTAASTTSNWFTAKPKFEPSERVAADPVISGGVASPFISSHMAKITGTKPPGGFDEAGNALNERGEPYFSRVDEDNAKNVVAETFKGLKTLAMNPMETIKGGLEFVTAWPGFLFGLFGAATGTVREITNQLALGNTLNLEDVYNVA